MTTCVRARRWLWLLLAASLGCSPDEVVDDSPGDGGGGGDEQNVDDGTNDGENNDVPVLFVIAGQSNAEGNVFLNGLSGLATALVPGTAPLEAADRAGARIAVAQSLGVWCEVAPECVDDPASCDEPQPFSHASADAVIDGLRSATVDWRGFNESYSHPAVKIVAANYRYAPVLVDDGNTTSQNEECTASAETTSLAGPMLDRYSQNDIVPLAPGFGADADAADGLTYGPELGFGAAIATGVAHPVILKVAMGGSSLNDHWRQGGPLYQALIDETTQVMADQGAVLGGFIWFQGFNDQFEGAYCQELGPRYQANLEEFLAAVRNDFSSPSLPVVIVGARSEGGLTQIQQAQNAVATSDSNTVVVTSAELSDCFHYGSGSQVLIGERAAAAMATLRQ